MALSRHSTQPPPTHTHTLTHSLTHTHTYTHTHTCAHAYTHTHAHMHTHRHTDIHTRARVRACARSRDRGAVLSVCGGEAVGAAPRPGAGTCTSALLRELHGAARLLVVGQRRHQQVARVRVPHTAGPRDGVSGYSSHTDRERERERRPVRVACRRTCQLRP
jgi:hypothetical protein